MRERKRVYRADSLLPQKRRNNVLAAVKAGAREAGIDKHRLPCGKLDKARVGVADIKKNRPKQTPGRAVDKRRRDNQHCNGRERRKPPDRGRFPPDHHYRERSQTQNP